MDFAMLPPEINSGLMYAGAGSGPLIRAAAAWQDLAEEMGAAADVCTAVLSELSGCDWQGPSSAAMVTAALPYVAWMRATASRAARAAGQAAAAANIYQTAFAATVPPPVIAENRTRLAVLVATNLLGQNTAAIAATDAAYAEMWAQDAVAMYRYAGDSAAAAELAPLTTAPAIAVGGVGRDAQSTAAATGGATNLTHAIADLPNILHALTSPAMDGMNIFSSANTGSGLAGLLDFLSGASNSALGDLLNTNLGDSIFSSGFWNPTGVFNVLNSFDYLLAYAAQDFVAAQGINGAGGLSSTFSQIGGVTSAQAPATALVGVHAGVTRATAELGRAALSGSLTVPQKWVTITTAMTNSGAATPEPKPATTPAGIGAGSTMLPNSSIPGTPRRKNRYARRYGFRPVVVPHPPAGG